MIVNSLLIGCVLFLLNRGKNKLKYFSELLSQIQNTKTINVSQLIKFAKEQKIPKFAIVKGYIKSRNPHDSHILSVIDLVPIRDYLSHIEYFKPIQWSKLIQRAFYVRPKNLKKIEIDLQDLWTSDKININKLENTSISGALNQIVRIQNVGGTNENVIKKIGKNMINTIIGIFPFNIIFSKFQFGQVINYYSIMDGQYSLIIGNPSIDPNGNVVMLDPKFITKQKNYIKKRLIAQINKIKFVLGVLMVIGLFFGYKMLKKAWIKYKKQFIQDQQIDKQIRSEQDKLQYNCIICYSNVRNVILKPCKHYGLCFSCYESLKQKNCPLCKCAIEGIIKVIKCKQ